MLLILCCFTEPPALVAQLRPAPAGRRSLGGRSAPNSGSPYWSGEHFQTGAEPAVSGQRSIVQAALAGAATPAIIESAKSIADVVPNASAYIEDMDEGVDQNGASHDVEKS